MGSLTNQEKDIIVPTDAKIEMITEAKNMFNAIKWQGIVWHHSASPDLVTRDWNGIVKYHTSYRIDFETVTKEEFERRIKSNEGKYFQTPWKAVGYHAGIELVGGIPILNIGRPLYEIGAHAGVKGASNRFNTEYIGMCAIGNYDVDTVSDQIWKFALEITKLLMKIFSISKTHVIGHREVYDLLGVPRQKTCPGKYWSMDNFRAEL